MVEPTVWLVAARISACASIPLPPSTRIFSELWIFWLAPERRDAYARSPVPPWTRISSVKSENVLLPKFWLDVAARISANASDPLPP